MLINHFGRPEAFWLLLLVWPLWALAQWRQNRSVLSVPVLGEHTELPGIRRAQAWIGLKQFLQFLILGLLVALVAQPQYRWKEKEIITHGVDIVVALDTSGSMAAEDLAGNRLESAKKIVQQFIRKRENDRIGLVVFGDKSFTKCPVTLDHDVLLNLVGGVTLGEAGDGTAIGMALVSALNRLRESDAKSQVVILVSDGMNTAGALGPKEASELARDLGIKVYTIGIGSDAGAPIPIMGEDGRKHYAVGPDGQPFLAQLNVEDLAMVADVSGGKFFRAQSAEKLKKIFDDIDTLEKSKIQSLVEQKASENFKWLALLALVLLLAYRYLTYTKLRFAT